MNINSIADKDFKIGLIKEYWNRRDRSLDPADSKGMGIKKQKFLVFYNLIAKNLKEKYTLKNLKAFEEGPVYYDIYSYISETGEFLEQKATEKEVYSEEILSSVLTLVQSESYSSLSKITHALDLWKNKYDPKYNEKIICENYKYDQNNIFENDITNMDKNILNILYEFNLDIYRNYNLEKINGKIFAIEKANSEKILSILNSDEYVIKNLIDELLTIDNLAKVNYYDEYKNNELGGILIDI